MDEKNAEAFAGMLCAIEDTLEKMKGVACICESLAVSSDAGKSRYAGSEMSLLCDVVESAVDELEGAMVRVPFWRSVSH